MTTQSRVELALLVASAHLGLLLAATGCQEAADEDDLSRSSESSGYYTCRQNQLGQRCPITSTDCCQPIPVLSVAFVLIKGSADEDVAEKRAKLEQLRVDLPGAFETATGGQVRLKTSARVEEVVVAPESFEIHAAVSQFYGEHDDSYDELIVARSFKLERDSGALYHVSVQNLVDGIGLRLKDSSQAWGSRGRLLGVVDMQSGSATTKGLLHELGHQWCCYVGDNFVGDRSGQLEIIQQGIHFYRGLESTAAVGDPMGADHWCLNDDKTTYSRCNASSDKAVQIFHPFALYLMGVLERSQYGVAHWIYDAGSGSSFHEQSAKPYRQVSVDDIVSAMGARTLASQPR